MTEQDDYVLGTHDEELQRLGLQHRVWRPVVLDCWEKAGISVGKSVLDLGAGPGYAAVDLAEIVGPTGQVVALERSPKFVQALRVQCHRHGLTNVQAHEVDLMATDLPQAHYDFSWCRWVLCFVSDPALLLDKLGEAMPRGGKSVFHEYAHYDSWRYLPPIEEQEEFRSHVVQTWREASGEPDVGRALPRLLHENGFIIRSITPHVFAVRPADYFWQWPATFIDVYLPRLEELGRVSSEFAARFRAELAKAEKKPNSFMITPLVLEIVAEKVR